MNIILCNIGWLKYYKGCDYEGEYDSPIGGGSYNKENIGLEEYNFRPYSDYYLGYVQPPGGGGNIFHPEKHFEMPRNAELIENVLVIWVATATKTTPMKTGRRIVGWYKNAVFFKNLQYDGIAGRDFYFKAKADDCICVPEDERSFALKHDLRNIAYFPHDKSEELRDYIDYINGYVGIIASPASGKEKEYIEGMTKHALLEFKTRNHQVVQAAKAAHKQKNNGRLPCQVCDFDFAQIYGEIGEDFIEAHHNMHHAKQGKKKIKISDLSLVCSNCHKMLHKAEGLTIDDLRMKLTDAVQ